MQPRYPELTHCNICPRFCGINRYQSLGYCQANANLKINLHQLHYGEEPVLSGTRGSGTIFFSFCNLKCAFCQNFNISAKGWGSERKNEEAVAIMLELQAMGAHNINLVTPTHYSIQLADVLSEAKGKGLSIPVVWNSNAYENTDTLEHLNGLVDIYLPDLKYADPKYSMQYSSVADYPSVSRQAILEMHRQVGKLVLDRDNIAQKGLIIRMLVLPGQAAGITESLHWIADNLGNDTAISLMAQYYPTWQSFRFPEINRGITQNEYDDFLETLERIGFENGFIQELSCSSEWTPAFTNQSNHES